MHDNARRFPPLVLWLALLGLAATMLLVGNEGVQLWDRDEPRYAVSAREMLQSKNWAVPTYLGALFPDKPPMLYWCQAACMAVLGENAAAARLPSAIATLLTLVVLSGVIWKTVGHRRGLWTGLVFISSTLVMVAGKTCLTDALLVLWVTIAQLCMYAAYAGRASKWTLAAMWVSIGLGVLTKLPVIIAVLGITAVVLAVMDAFASRKSIFSPKTWWDVTKWWWRTHPWIGIPIVALIVGPWVYQLLHQSKGAMIERAIYHDVWKRFTTPLEGHGGPPGYYLVATLISFIPWVALLPRVMYRSFQNRHLPPIRFALAAAIGPWFMFEIARTKLPGYMLPCYPALAFLTGDFIVRCLRGQHADLKLWTVRYGAIAAGLGTAALAAAPWVPMLPKANLEPGPIWALVVTSLTALLAGGVVIRVFLTNRADSRGLAYIGGAMLGLTIVLAGVYLPNATFLKTSKRVGGFMKDAGGEATEPGKQFMIGYQEPSLAFYQGGTIRQCNDDSYLLTTPPEQWKPWLTVSKRMWDKVPEDRKTQSGFVVIGSFRGWNYSAGGRIDEVMVLKRASAASPGPTPKS